MPGTQKTPPHATPRTEPKPWCRTLGTGAADGELRGNLRSFTRRMLQRVARSNWGRPIDSAYRYGDKVLDIRVQARRFRPGWGPRFFIVVGLPMIIVGLALIARYVVGGT